MTVTFKFYAPGGRDVGEKKKTLPRCGTTLIVITIINVVPFFVLVFRRTTVTSDEKITHHEVGWSPLRNHPINVRGGQVSDAALAVRELPAALQ